VRDDLRRRGWDTNSPAAVPTGQVYDQHEYQDDPGLAEALGGKKPENVVVVDATARIFWVLEVKPAVTGLAQAAKEAAEYAALINAVPGQRCAFYTAIAGSPHEGYVRRTYYIAEDGTSHPVQFEGSPLTSLLPREQLLELVKGDTGEVAELELDEQELLRVADRINETLHAASIQKDDRASVVASVLLTIAQDNMPDAKLDVDAYVAQLNITAKARLARAGKDHFADHIKLRLPRGEEAKEKYRGALVATADALRHINIAAAMRSGLDVLGEFYEAFLKYGNAAKDIGIVLTPRHITRWAAEVLPMTHEDVVYDPTCGTGGFLVSAYDHIRTATADEDDFAYFKAHRLFGIEQQPRIAALTVVNMIFRGDGSTNIIDDDALRQSLVYATKASKRTGKFVARRERRSTPPGATRVLMNPPFALEKQAEAEYEFVQHALDQMEDGGLLLAILPAPVMVKSGGPLAWRKDRLLPEHTVRAVVSLPEDLFYPVSVDTVALIVEKGRPHKADDEVVWARVRRDGHMKFKGKRLRSDRVQDDLAAITEQVTAVVRNRREQVTSVPGLIKKTAIDFSDTLLELVPQAYLDEPVPTPDEVRLDLEHAVKEYLSFLIRTADPATFETALKHTKPGAVPAPPAGFKFFSMVELFGPVGSAISRGDIHALNKENPGLTPVVTTSTDMNGIESFYDLPTWTKHKNVVTVASNGTPLTSFYHPYETVVKDDLFICAPPAWMTPATIFYVITALNRLTWRFSYYRKCYLNKLDKIAVPMPVDANGDIDQKWIAAVAQSCDGWNQLVKAMPTWQPAPWRALGRRTWNAT
jgi:type I restriction enzyme M protein